MVPLIILGFVSYSIAKMKDNASKMLSLALVIAYLSSIGAAFFAMVSGYTLIPHLSIEPVKETLRQLPELIFRLDIPPVVSVMTALVLAIMIGLATVWTKSEVFENLLDNFQKMVLLLINRILIPILPFFIAANFCALSYEGAITKQLPVFLGVMVIVIISQFFLVRPCRSRLEKKSLAGIEVLRPRLPHGCRHDVIRCHVSRCVKMCQEKSSIKRRCY